MSAWIASARLTTHGDPRSNLVLPVNASLRCWRDGEADHLRGIAGGAFAAHDDPPADSVILRTRRDEDTCQQHSKDEGPAPDGLFPSQNRWRCRQRASRDWGAPRHPLPGL